MDRRAFLGAGARAAAALGIAKALTNTIVGYGEFGIGDNLVDDPPAAIAHEEFPTDGRFRHRLGEWELGNDEHGIEVSFVGETSPQNTPAVPPHEVTKLADHVEALRTDRFAFRFEPVASFFELLRRHTPLPNVVAVLRPRYASTPAPETIRTFAGCDPADSAALVDGLAQGFARATRYDAPRYVAGSIDDNLLPFRAGLRGWLRPDYSFEALAEADSTSLFCGEYTLLANRAFRAVPPGKQDPPITGLRVVDRRHKHVYNALASAIETEEGLIIPMTFVDYTYTTLYADLELESVLGDGLDAFDRRHRADRIWWG